MAGGWLVAVRLLNFNPTVYIRNTASFVQGWDVGSGLIKAAVFGVIVALTTSLLVPILPELAAQLGPSTQWLLTSTLLVSAVAVPVVGRLADLYGKRRMLVLAAAALTVGSLICALSDTLPWLIVGRAVTGLSTAAASSRSATAAACAAVSRAAPCTCGAQRSE